MVPMPTVRLIVLTISQAPRYTWLTPPQGASASVMALASQMSMKVLKRTRDQLVYRRDLTCWSPVGWPEECDEAPDGVEGRFAFVAGDFGETRTALRADQPAPIRHILPVSVFLASTLRPDRPDPNRVADEAAEVIAAMAN